jgi:P4 family phage/plasmid primase-like protien
MRLVPLETEVLGMMATDQGASAAPVTPDPAMIATFADAVFGYCDHLVPVRALAEKGGVDQIPHTPFMDNDADFAAKLAVQAGWAADNGMALFVVPGTVAISGEAKADQILQTQVVLVDLDHGDIGAKRDHLVAHLGEPTMEVASGGVTAEGQRKLHLYWRLSEPAEGDDITTVCRARYMIACKVGGDTSFRSAHQPIRVAGSVHAKSGQRRLVEILQHREKDHDLGDLVEAVMAMPPMEGEAPNALDFNDAGSGHGAVTELFGRVVREGGVDGTTRFEALTRIIGYWIRRCREGHVTAQQAWQEIVDYNNARIDPPWEKARLRSEAEKIWKLDAARYGDDYLDAATGGGPPAGGGQSGGISAPVQLTEDALAEAFTDQHSEDWRYVAAWGQWLTWTGAVWRKEETLQAYDLSRQICRSAARKAASAKLKAKLSSASTIAAVERIARADRRHAETTEVWDRNPWLLNTPGGIVDLQSAAIGPHDRPAYMTKITAASPEGNCPTWLEFLDTVTGGDVELQRYLQRMAGYCLTGVTTEHALFFLYGTGANGKSVFANTLTAIIGDYATVAAMDMFMASHGDRHPTDMAGLRGARVVSAIETEQGSRWAESKLKALTGGDKITARFMRQDFFEFMPQFKLLVVGNHKPSIRNVDEAMRRRLHMIPFTVTIPAHKRDKRLPDRLLAERDGILAWALQGCLEWQRTGLKPPASVLAATEEYFEAEDALGRWLEERCDQAPHLQDTSQRLYADWKSWADANGEFAGSNKRFSETLTNRGFQRANTNKARGFRGVALRQAQPQTSPMEF